MSRNGNESLNRNELNDAQSEANKTDGERPKVKMDSYVSRGANNIPKNVLTERVQSLSNDPEFARMRDQLGDMMQTELPPSVHSEIPRFFAAIENEFKLLTEKYPKTDGSLEEFMRIAQEMKRDQAIEQMAKGILNACPKIKEFLLSEMSFEEAISRFSEPFYTGVESMSGSYAAPYKAENAAATYAPVDSQNMETDENGIVYEKVNSAKYANLFPSDRDLPYAEELLHARLQVAGIDVEKSTIGYTAAESELYLLKEPPLYSILNRILGMVTLMMVKNEMKNGNEKQS